MLAEVKRLILLAEEGLLCPSCHQELHGKAELDARECTRCARRARWLRCWFDRQMQKGGAA